MALLKSQINKFILDYLGYTLYSAILNQTGTSAPVPTKVVNKFGAVTFTWARSGVGIYTVTANSAVFTANQTVVVMGVEGLKLRIFDAVVTSTTVITLNTATIAFNTPSTLLASNGDALLTNILFEIRVYT